MPIRNFLRVYHVTTCALQQKILSQTAFEYSVVFSLEASNRGKAVHRTAEAVTELRDYVQRMNNTAEQGKYDQQELI